MPISSRSAAFLFALLLLTGVLSACDNDGSDNEEPRAAFSLSTGEPVATRAVQFTDESTDPDGQISAWTWQFGNGDTSAEQNPTYTYAAPGDYDVTLTVTDDEGDTSMDTTRTITVFEAGPLAAAQDETWTWINIDGAFCRDGSGTGFGVRTRPDSDALFIFLQGGGACFSEDTCAGNPASFDEDDFEALVAQRGEAGILDPDNDENPVEDWNAVFVPYCTGDVHAGSNPDGTAPGAGPQQFVGHENVERYLDALKTYFRSDLDQVLLTGSSAGGFGTLVNFDGVAQRFGGAEGAETYLLDDSGPLFYDDNVLPPVLQGLLVALWNLEDSLPPDAGELLEPDSLPEVYGFYADKYPEATFGLASHLQDAVIRDFFGIAGPISGPEYTAGLVDLNEQAPAAWGTYYQTSDQHTFLGGDRFYTTTVDGVALTDWVDDLLDGEVSDVAPIETTNTAAARR